MSLNLADSKVLGKLSSTLVGKWQISASIPAFFFWGGVFLIWFFTHDCDFLPTPLTPTFPSGFIRVVLIVAPFCFLVIVSSNLVEWATFPALRLLEGYWEPESGALPLIGHCIKEYEKKKKKLKIELNNKRNYLKELDKKYIEEGRLSPEEQELYTNIFSEITNYPEDENNVLPTKLGNFISAAEEYPYRHYGSPLSGFFLFVIFPPLSGLIGLNGMNII